MQCTWQIEQWIKPAAVPANFCVVAIGQCLLALETWVFHDDSWLGTFIRTSILASKSLTKASHYNVFFVQCSLTVINSADLPNHWCNSNHMVAPQQSLFFPPDYTSMRNCTFNTMFFQYCLIQYTHNSIHLNKTIICWKQNKKNAPKRHFNCFKKSIVGRRDICTLPPNLRLHKYPRFES